MKIGARAAALAVYFVMLPYLSRIGGGTEWVMQYLPPPDRLIFGLLFFGVFNAIPGVVLAALAAGSRMATIAAFTAMTVLTIYFHYDYDLASDAQAAIGLVVWPFFVTAGGLAVFVVVLGIQSLGRWFNRTAGRADE